VVGRRDPAPALGLEFFTSLVKPAGINGRIVRTSSRDRVPGAYRPRHHRASSVAALAWEKGNSMLASGSAVKIPAKLRGHPPPYLRSHL